MKTFRLVSPLLLICMILSIPAPVRADDTPPEKAFIENFSGHHQNYNLSCESASAADLASFWGLSTTEDDVLLSLPITENPNEGFVGFYNGPWGYIPPSSYGVHAGPIAKRLVELGLNATERLGMTSDELRLEVAAGRPVIVWIIGAMWNGQVNRIELTDGTQVDVAPYEHTMIITGYDKDIVQTFDPAYGIVRNFYWSAFESSWSVLGNMAVTADGLIDAQESASATPEEPTATPTAVPEGVVMYTVEYGDYLIQLGEKFDVDWRWLVEVNNLPYPWTLFPGQVIRVK
jgi:uncharacterized protein YvpB